MFRLDHAYQKSIPHLQTVQTILIWLCPCITCQSIAGSLWNQYRDEVNNDAIENNDIGNYGINNSKTITSKHFEYKTKIIGNTPADNNTLDTEVVVSFNFLRFDLPLINCETELDLS